MARPSRARPQYLRFAVSRRYTSRRCKVLHSRRFHCPFSRHILGLYLDVLITRYWRRETTKNSAAYNESNRQAELRPESPVQSGLVVCDPRNQPQETTAGTQTRVQRKGSSTAI